ncbi:MAG: alpha/beta hydrolase [Methylococcales bacterium]
MKTIFSFSLISLLLLSCTSYRDRIDGRTAKNSANEFTVNTYIYSTVGKQKLTGDLFLPEQGSHIPLVIMIHGGSWARGKKEQMTPVAEQFVRAGIAVFNISYRFAPAHHWPAQRQDLENALAFILKNKQRFSIDYQRIGAFGYSSGAHLALMLAYHPDRDKQESTRLSAVAAGGAPVDLTVWPKSKSVEQLIGHPYSTHSHLFKEASPISYVRAGLPPTFLYHGEHDWVVEVEQSQKLVAALKKVNVEAEYYELFFGHFVTFLFDEEQVAEMISFFRDKFNTLGGS